MGDMCKYDEAFTKQEMREETDHCSVCSLDCEYAGKRKPDYRWFYFVSCDGEAFKKHFDNQIEQKGFVTVHAISVYLSLDPVSVMDRFGLTMKDPFDYGWTSKDDFSLADRHSAGMIFVPHKLG